MELDQNTGMPKGLIGKITLREPSLSLRQLGLMSVDDLLKKADEALVKSDTKFWVLLDRLDAAFSESPQLESNALRALFRVYLDLIALKAISLKIFLRSDIWSRIQSSQMGFREASHISRHTTIQWTNQSLLNLVVRRLLYNEIIQSQYLADRTLVLAEARLQIKLFNEIFPPQANLDWMLYRLRDGSGQTAPRELIHTLHCARDIQIKNFELGGPEPGGKLLFTASSFLKALPEVSRVRFELTLLAEYPQFRQQLLRLTKEKAHLSTLELGKIWQVTPKEAGETAEQLVEVGFFERKGERNDPLYWVPPLYQVHLKIKP
jgi:hypothetical protein